MDYEAEVKKHGSIKAAARASGIAYTTFHDRYRRATQGHPHEPATPAKDIGGIRLSESVRVRASKPSEGIKKKLFALKRGVGYPVSDLADNWGCSPDTLKSHARRHDALRYVEVGPGDWVHCVMHPETATQHGDA